MVKTTVGGVERGEFKYKSVLLPSDCQSHLPLHTTNIMLRLLGTPPTPVSTIKTQHFYKERYIQLLKIVRETLLVFSVLTASVYLYSVYGQLDQYSADAGAGGADGGLEVNIPGIPGEDYPL